MSSRPFAARVPALLAAGALTILVCAASTASAAPISFDPPGKLVPARSGRGRVDAKLYAPTMRFPMEANKAFANSQVYGNGGGQGPGGGQCDVINYDYPWHDNYCESRSYSMPLCPAGVGHQGQDIRPPTCVRDVHWVVAAETGTITSIGSFSVYLTTASGTRFEYLHMSMLQVKVGDSVTRGQRLGKVSNLFGGTPTTIHLHMNIRQNIAGQGIVYVPPYASLIESYRRANGLVLDAGIDSGRDGGKPSGDAATVDAGEELEADASIPLDTDAGPEELNPAEEATEVPAPDGGCGCRQSASSASLPGAFAMVAALVAARVAFGTRRRKRV